MFSFSEKDRETFEQYFQQEVVNKINDPQQAVREYRATIEAENDEGTRTKLESNRTTFFLYNRYQK